MIDFGKEPGLKELLSRKRLGDQFKEELEKIISETREISDCWEVSTLQTLGKRKTSVYASFKLKKEILPVNKRMDEFFHLRNVLFTELEQLFWFTTTVRYITTRAFGTLMILYHPLRKKDPVLLKYQKVINYSYVEMVRKNPDLQEELKNTNYFEWIYDLNAGSPGTYSEFNSSTFSFGRIYLKRDFFPHNRSKFIRIPSLGALKGRLFKFKDDNAIRDGFKSWLKKNEVSSIDDTYNSIIALFLKFFMEFRYDKRWNHSLEEWFLIPHEFQVNEFLTLRLERYHTNIYVNGKLFNQCKYLLLNIPEIEISDHDEIESIDEAAEKLGRRHEGNNALIPAETEFWGHCSNLQAWHENEYDTRLLHRNLAFPLLKELTRVGDPRARKVFKEEIARRFESGYDNVITFLIAGGYLTFLEKEEKEIILINALRKGNISLIRTLISGTFDFKRIEINDETLSSPRSQLFKEIEELFNTSSNRATAINFLSELFRTRCKPIAINMFSELFKRLLKEENITYLFEMIQMDNLYKCLSPEILRLLTMKMIETGDYNAISFLLKQKFIPLYLSRKDLSVLQLKHYCFLYCHPLLHEIMKHSHECSHLQIFMGHLGTLRIQFDVLNFYEKNFFPGYVNQLSSFPHVKARDKENLMKVRFRSQNYYFSPKAHLNERILLIRERIHDFILNVLGSTEEILIYFFNETYISISSDHALPDEIQYINLKTGVECRFSPEVINEKHFKDKDRKLFKIPNRRPVQRGLISDPDNYMKITDFLNPDKNKEEVREILISSSPNQKIDKNKEVE